MFRRQIRDESAYTTRRDQGNQPDWGEFKESVY